MAGNFFDQFDTAESRPSGNLFDQFDAPMAEQAKQNSGLAGDLATDIKRGVQKLPGALTGLADIPVAAVTGERYVSRAADALGEATGFQPGKWAEAAANEYSPRRKAGAEAIERAWQGGGAADIAGAYLSNPGNIAGLVAESLPSMVAGGLVGRAALAGAARLAPSAAAAPLAPVVAGAAGEGAMIAGQSMANISEDVDARRAAAASAGAGLVGTGLGVGGGILARRLGVIDPETAIAGGVAAAGRAPMGFTRRLAGGATAEGLFEEVPQSVAEQAAQNWAEQNPIGEGVARAAVEGGIAGGLMGAGANVMPTGRAQQTQPPAIDPNAGPMSKAASMAQQANAAAVAQQQQLADEEAGAAVAGEDPRIAAARQAQAQQAQERARLSELATMQDAAEDEIVGATGFADQAETADFNRFVGQEAKDLEQRRARAADSARLERAGVRADMRTARDQLIAEGAFEADQRAQQREQFNADAVPFERILPQDYDTLNPIRAGEGEVLDRERAPTRALPGPDRAESLQAPDRRQAIEFRPRPNEPLRATPEGEVGTRQQFDEMADTRATRREQMRRAREQARFVSTDAEARAARTVPYTEQTAQREAERLSNARQEPFTVVPHPGRGDRFAVVPARVVSLTDQAATSQTSEPEQPVPQTEAVRESDADLPDVVTEDLDPADGEANGAVPGGADAGMVEARTEEAGAVVGGGAGVAPSQPDVSANGDMEPASGALVASGAPAEPAGDVGAGQAAVADLERPSEAFVAAPDGSIDFGEITPEMAQAMRRQAGKIRLQDGVQNADGTGWGLSHIEANHGDQIRNAGFESVQHFVSHVARNFNEVLQAKNRQLLVAIDGGRQDVMFVQLEPTHEGDFYRINTAFPASRNYLEKQQKKGMKLLWGGSEPAPAAAGQQPPYAGAPAEESGQGAPIARGQSSDATVAQQPDAAGAPAAKPDGRYTTQERGNRARKNDGYTQDLFGSPVSEARRVPDTARVQPGIAGAEALRAAGEVEGAKYAVEAGPSVTGFLKSAFERVKSAPQAAHTLAGLRKNAAEHFQALVLDADNRPISVLNLFAGAITQASVYPEVVTKAIYETPGAAKVWFAHNHPSGKAEPSNADAILTRKLSDAFGPGTGIEVAGHVVIAGTRAAELDAEGFEVGRAFSIPAGARTQSIKITERRFKKVGTLGRVIDSPAKAREDVPAIAGGKAGVVFLNAQHGPVGFLPMDVEQMKMLRDGKGARLLFGAAARSNASAALLHFPSNLARADVLAAATNLYEALNPRDIRVLDALHGTDSYAERDELAGNGKGFMPLTGREASRPQQDGLTRDGIRDAIASRFPSLARPLDAMLKRGDEGMRGGVVVVERPEDLADVFASKTGRSMDEAIQLLGSNQNGDIQGFFDPRSGLTFLVAPNLTAETAPAVLLHEAVHGKQREEIDRKALQMIENRGTRAEPLRAFLLRVAQRMEDAGESGNSAEAASYIVEQAVTEGRQAGFSAIDGKLLNWIDATIGKPVGDLVRGFVAMIRAWALRKGFSYAPSVDDLVAIARSNLQQMARGDATGGERVQASRLARSPSTIAAAWDSPEPSKLDSLIYTLQNKQIDMKRVVDAVKEQVGEIEDQWNPYLQEELFHGRSAKGVRDFLAHEMRPLLAQMRRSGVDMGELERFLHARHAPEANAHIARINPNEPDLQDGGSGMTNQEAADHLASIAPDRRRALEALAKQVDTINANTRKLMVESGLETAETIQAWEAAYQHYVPLQREDVESGGLGVGQGYSVRGPASKRRTGSKKAVIDILANIALQRERTIVRAEKNRVAQANYALAIKAPNTDFWMPVNPDEAKAYTPAQQTRMVAELVGMGLDPADAENFVKEPVQRYVDPRTGLVAEQINPALRGADNVLALRIEGKDRFVFFNRKDDRAQRMVHALKNLDADQLGHVFGALAKLTRFFAAVNTQWNPIFGVVNLTRDTQAALLQLSTTPIRGSEKAVLKNVLPAMRGIYAALRAEREGEALPNSPWAKAFDEFRNEGGQTGYRDMFSNSQERADALKRELDPEGWMDSPLGKAFTANGALRVPMARAQKMAGGLFNWLSDYNDTLENAVRLSAYMEAKAKGLSNAQAASIAKNLTVNFNRKGQIATQAGALYAFFNAAMQGTTRMLQTLKGPAGRKIILGGLTLGALQAVTLAAAGFDDEEPPEFVRERSIVIPLGDGKYASIPMPLGFHVIPSMSRILTEWALSGFRDTTKRFGDFVALFADTFNPIGNAGWSMQTLAPTALDPVAALTENRDWTGRPIAQQDFNSLRPTPGYARARDTASEVSKALAYWINLSTGGTDYKPGLISPTPDQIDYLIGQVTGGVGREYLKAEQTATSLWTGEELPPHKAPLLGRFYGDATGQSSEATRFYNNLREINLHRAEIDGRRKDGGDVQGYLRDNPAARIGMAGPIQVEGQVRKLREAKRIAVEQGDTARVRVIDGQITMAMRRFNERVTASAQ